MQVKVETYRVKPGRQILRGRKSDEVLGMYLALNGELRVRVEQHTFGDTVDRVLDVLETGDERIVPGSSYCGSVREWHLYDATHYPTSKPHVPYIYAKENAE